MPSDKPDRVEQWRHPVAQVKTIDADKFAELVLESGLRVVGPSGGYLYAALETDDGHDMYRTFVGFESAAIATSATANPAAGANPAAVTVAAGKRMLLTRVYTTLTTDANVANRYVALTITDGSATVGIYRMVAAHTASVGPVSYTFAPGLEATTALATYMQQGIDQPGIELSAGWTFQVTALSIQAGDDFGVVQYSYKEADA